ncbi:MAG: hypothetical protein F6K65_39140, partial [Moorea sp. SIO3C2]|nr:hypothetical protein [Moorena sp. SIO3C2]
MSRTGTLTLVGLGVESWLEVLSRTGTLTLVGLGVESWLEVFSRTGTDIVLGLVLEFSLALFGFTGTDTVLLLSVLLSVELLVAELFLGVSGLGTTITGLLAAAFSPLAVFGFAGTGWLAVSWKTARLG